MKAFLDPGDTLALPSLNRYGRSLPDLVTMVADLRTRELGFTSPHQRLNNTTTPGGRLVFHVLATLAEFIRGLRSGPGVNRSCSVRPQEAARAQMSLRAVSLAR